MKAKTTKRITIVNGKIVEVSLQHVYMHFCDFFFLRDEIYLKQKLLILRLFVNFCGFILFFKDNLCIFFFEIFNFLKKYFCSKFFF